MEETIFETPEPQWGKGEEASGDPLWNKYQRDKTPLCAIKPPKGPPVYSLHILLARLTLERIAGNVNTETLETQGDRGEEHGIVSEVPED